MRVWERHVQCFTRHEEEEEEEVGDGAPGSHREAGRQESEDGGVWILIPLQMAGSVWKSKHFKMKSSNDWSNDHGHTLGKHIQVEEQPHKKLPAQPKAPHLPAAATLCWMHRDFTLNRPDCCLRRSVEILWCKSDATIYRCWHIKFLLWALFYL